MSACGDLLLVSEHSYMLVVCCLLFGDEVLDLSNIILLGVSTACPLWYGQQRRCEAGPGIITMQGLGLGLGPGIITMQGCCMNGEPHTQGKRGMESREGDGSLTLD